MDTPNRYSDNSHDLNRSRDIRVILRTLRGDDGSWTSLDLKLKSAAECTLCGKPIAYDGNAKLLIIDDDHNYLLHPTCVRLVEEGDFDALAQQSAVFKRLYSTGMNSSSPREN
jgi:hypothetical protein